MERWTLGRGAAPAEHAWRVEPRSLELWTVLDGAATLAWEGGSASFERFESVAVPARVGPARWRGDAVLVRGTA
jgi:mannose-6-phosphate isomerase-like protein (cupin superfamily)